MKVKLEIEDENGKKIEITEEIDSVGKMSSVTEIENFVLSLRHKLLPKTEQKIIEESQNNFDEKKIKKKNGKRFITIHTLNGSYEFCLQLYELLDGSNSNYIEMTENTFSGNYSQGLDKYIINWANEVSFEKLSDLIEQTTGERQLSAAGLENYVIRCAEEISYEWLSSSSEKIIPITIESKIDLYAEKAEEICVMIDDVGVKAQKPKREQARKETDKKRIDTTVGLISDESGKYIALTQGINREGEIIYPFELSLHDMVRELHCCENPLPIVAITDGARSIRLSLYEVFGLSVCIILDWYHLQKKVIDLMAMISTKKSGKEEHILNLNALLWKGNVESSIEYIEKLDNVRNKEKQRELLSYLEKHREEIIDYELRQSIGKPVGSGRGEKANDIIVAHRQKKKGMSWSQKGSYALAILKVYQLQQRIFLAS